MKLLRLLIKKIKTLQSAKKFGGRVAGLRAMEDKLGVARAKRQLARAVLG
jgi:hypothetical protein